MEKYNLNRNNIRNGDIILFRNNSQNILISHSIQKLDKAYYNHIGLVFTIGTAEETRYFIIDSNQPGVKIEFLSDRMNMYEDFCVMRPRSSWREIAVVQSAVCKVIQRAETHIKYDMGLVLEFAVERSLGRNVMTLNNGNADICSEFTLRYIKELYSIAYDVTRREWGWISPQDTLRFRDPHEFDVLLDSNPGIHLDYEVINLP